MLTKHPLSLLLLKSSPLLVNKYQSPMDRLQLLKGLNQSAGRNKSNENTLILKVQLF